MIQKVLRSGDSMSDDVAHAVVVCDACRALAPAHPIADLLDDAGAAEAARLVAAAGWMFADPINPWAGALCPRCAPPAADSSASLAVVSAVDGAGDPTPAEEVSHVAEEGGGHGAPSGQDEAQTEAAETPRPPPDAPAPYPFQEPYAGGVVVYTACQSDLSNPKTREAVEAIVSAAAERLRAQPVRLKTVEPVIIAGEPTFPTRPALSSAVFSPCRRYRYRLRRGWDMALPRVLFVMLNPSIADEQDDDQTMRKCIGFAKKWGFGSLDVGNLFGWISTDPKALRAALNPIGDTDAHVLEMACEASWVVLAWGKHGSLYGRGDAMRALFTKNGIAALGFPRVKNGQPSHPLMLPYTTQPEPWR